MVDTLKHMHTLLYAQSYVPTYEIETFSPAGPGFPGTQALPSQKNGSNHSKCHASQDP